MEVEPRLTAGIVSDQLVKGMEARVRDPRMVWGLPYGFNGLDKLTGGIHKGEMSIVAARPKVGKSFFMAQVAANVARYLLTEDGRKRHPDQAVKLVSCEMSAAQFQQRLVCQLAEVSDRRVRSGRLNPEQQKRYRQAAAEVGKLPIEYLDAPKGLDSTLRWLREGRRCAWWALDYIGIHPAGVQSIEDNPFRKVTYLSAGFRDFAKEHAPGLVVSQMNRNIEKRPPAERRPMLSDLRDSGNLEQDVSGFVGALYRPDMDTKVPTEEALRPKPAELVVLGHRNGPLGTIELVWLPTLPGFVDTSELIDDMEAA